MEKNKELLCHIRAWLDCTDTERREKKEKKERKYLTVTVGMLHLDFGHRAKNRMAYAQKKLLARLLFCG